MQRLGLGILVVVAGVCGPVAAQQTRPVLTADDYARAEKFMAYNTDALVSRGPVRPNWLDADTFWYRNTVPEGLETVVVNPVARTRVACPGAVTTCGGVTIPAPAPPPPTTGPPAVVSPDGTRAAFVRDHNLWVREVATGAERQMTRDGVEHFAYATNNAGWVRSDVPVLLWSSDSRRIATFQHDGRQVGDMYLVNTVTGHPSLQAWKYPLPGDEHIFAITRVVIDVATATVTRLLMPPDPHRSTLCDHVVCGGRWVDVHWTADDTQVAFVSVSRDHKQATLRVADAASGEVRTVLEERAETFFESGNGRVNWQVLSATNEVVWYSQRDDWGHLYLYDLQSGELKRQITSGAWNVTQVMRVDEQARVIYFQAVGREPGDPYFRHLYRVGFDGARVEWLTPSAGDHVVDWSPSGRFFVDTVSQPHLPPVSVLRSASGALVLNLERADISRLIATGWTPPIPFTVKARDGETDLHGLMYQPYPLDPSKKYPIINNIYPGPQTGSVRSRSFAAARGDARALAELGFVVVQIDGMGTPWRSKPFHEAYYGDMGDNTLPDQVAGMQQLAERFPFIDLERAGIYGHSGGGYATAGAMFRYPDFFKVGVSQAGNHDNRGYADAWAEKWQGLVVTNADGTSNYDDQANQTHAGNLKGKLLLAHGTLDANVLPYSTLLVVDALIRHNKDFDLLLLPNRGHGFGNEPYMVRRRWDYFVEHLMGATPPPTYTMQNARVP